MDRVSFPPQKTQNGYPSPKFLSNVNGIPYILIQDDTVLAFEKLNIYTFLQMRRFSFCREQAQCVSSLLVVTKHLLQSFHTVFNYTHY